MVHKQLVINQAQSQKYKKDDVAIIDADLKMFVVTGSRQYQVTFSTPAQCDCYYFRRSCVLCKHFFAVMRHTQFRFTDICPLYRECAYISLDLHPHILDGGLGTVEKFVGDLDADKKRNDVNIKLHQIINACFDCNNAKVFDSILPVLSSTLTYVKSKIPSVQSVPSAPAYIAAPQ